VHTRFKRFLLIFLMLALPLQAFASVAMLGCEHARSGAEFVAPVAMAMSGCHEAPADQPLPPAAEHQCSHCAACCLASALPIPAAGTTDAMPVPYTPYPHPSVQFSGFLPEGPERPPRTPLA
jgi:hypothetical protein